jgi:hypothetical protein
MVSKMHWTSEREFAACSSGAGPVAIHEARVDDNFSHLSPEALKNASKSMAV